MFWQRGTLGPIQNLGLTQLASVTHHSEDPMVHISLFYDRLPLIYMYFLMPKPEETEIKKVLDLLLASFYY